ncbi:MAG TPA: DNA repair protein RadC [Sphingomonadaceae bacterium]|nr:DNA repair protein RadC [Sphingomonadaceae bacterium]
MNEPDPAADASGHRARLRKRLAEQGPEALQDHELVEYLLALAIPRRDTKPIARRLLAEFGGFGRLMAADAATLARIGGIGEGAIAALKIAEASALRLLRSKVVEQPVLASWQALLDYLHADMAHRPIERVRALHLSGRNMLIRDELVAEGTIDQAAVHVREIIRRAIDLSSAAIILVHNHPGGDPTPSRQDIQLTREVVEAGRPLGITVHDHVIIGANGHKSMRALGLI